MDSPSDDALTGVIPIPPLELPASTASAGPRTVKYIAREDLTYEQLLDRDPEWAMSEGGRFFDENSRVFQALRNITQRLNTLGIPYAVIGGMALFRHGYRRFTEHVDILVTKENLKRIHEHLSGLGYLPPHPKSKNLRDTETKVKIEFLQAGEYPGDGLEKPIAFPDPGSVSFEADGVSYIRLEHLIELKLASGMTGAGRLKDLADVLELIKTLHLSLDLGERLHPYVREKYRELAGQSQTRYAQIRTQDWLSANAESAEEMRHDSVSFEDVGGADGYVRLVTTDPNIAAKYDMLDESEIWDNGQS